VAEVKYIRPAILRRIPRDNHSVIEASAGTGKTHTLEHLVVDLILSGACTIEQILVMTFTEKATAELRARVRSVLERLIGGDAAAQRPGDDVVRLDDAGHKRIRDALSAFSRAPIFTIHGFCRRVLGDLAFDSGTRFIVDVAPGKKLFHETFRTVLREHLAVDEDAAALLGQWLDDNNAEKLEKLLYEAYRNRYLATGASERNRTAVEELAAKFEAKSLQRDFAEAPVLRAASLEAARASIDSLARLTADARGSAHKLRRGLAQFDFNPLLKPRWVGEQLVKFRAAMTPWTLSFLEAAERAQIACSLEVQIADTFLPPIAERLARDKREHGAIDYDDMLAWLWNALDGPRGDTLVAALRERYCYAIVDEFQDTDDLQWQILRRIFVAGARPPYLCVIGDPKQAIYAFRGADVFTYRQARGELAEFGPSVPLIENFRSTANMIAACNVILDQRAGPPFFSGAISYDNPVKSGRDSLRALDADEKPIQPVTLMRLDETGATASEARAAIGRYIAATIHGILSEPAQRITMRGVEDGSRAVSAEEIFILTRTGAESLEIGKYLREAGVPFAFYKQEGLFQAGEAADILDVLRAIEEPGDRSRRLKAWATPFFAVPLRELANSGDLDPAHPLSERLREWNGLAEDERFAELFDRMLHRSGLVDRELFLSDSGRELTNYLHLFEILLEHAHGGRLSIGELIELLDDYVAGRAVTAREDPGVQRLESERKAVQVMTVHKSKGLEADVVFLFGGAYRINSSDPVAVFHEGFERRVAIGKTAKNAAIDRLKCEQEEEEQRLLYVAITRARAKLYLPFFPTGSTRTAVSGYYRPLNARLMALEADHSRYEFYDQTFRVEKIRFAKPEKRDEVQIADAFRAWTPPESLLRDEDAAVEAEFRRIRRRRAPLLVRSYTSLQRFATVAEPFGPEPEDFKTDEIDAAAAEAADLPGGRSVGIFLHEVLEKLDFATLDDSVNLAAWKARDDIRDLIASSMRRHQVLDPRWHDRAAEIVFNTLRTTIEVDRMAKIDGGLYRCQNVREMEFVYPIPELHHPLLSASRDSAWMVDRGYGDGAWTVERGYLKGFVDLVFEFGNLVYFADWKSDLLTSYAARAVEEHVKDRYELQARIYSIGVMRLLGIRSEREYESRFGGLLYLFIRGIGVGGSTDSGVYFHRPRWGELVASERELIGVVPALEGRP
jgi:exodeoxyribonuclease V beta subunit